MSILNVEHLTHGFGDRAIFADVSFRLLKGEHIGLVGANGEGKSTFLNIVTGKLMALDAISLFCAPLPANSFTCRSWLNCFAIKNMIRIGGSFRVRRSS